MDYWTKSPPGEVLTGAEHLMLHNNDLSITIRDFWKWHMTDLFNNTMRGGLAEFIVATAMKIPTNTFRQDWGPYDLLYNSKIRIEVKSSAYLQSWSQQKLSTIVFGIQPARAWTDEQQYNEDYRRHSDVYVFCLFACKDKKIADPINLSQWNFFVLNTNSLNQLDETERVPRKTISLVSLQKLNPIATDYRGIEDAVKTALCLK